MKIVIDFDRKAVIQFFQKYIVQSIRFLYNWLTTDGEVLGYILAIFHFMISVSVFSMVIFSHTIYPSFYFQLLTFIVLFVIWLQHIFLRVCVYVVAEKELTQTVSPYSEMLKELLKTYNIKSDQFITYFILTETVGVGCFALELISRTSVYVQRYFMKNSI